MDKTEINMDTLNKVIAFKLLRILRNNGFIEDGKYANIERKSIQYGRIPQAGVLYVRWRIAEC